MRLTQMACQAETASECWNLVAVQMRGQGARTDAGNCLGKDALDHIATILDFDELAIFVIRSQPLRTTVCHDALAGFDPFIAGNP